MFEVIVHTNTRKNYEINDYYLYFINDSFVNENFGDKFITLAHQGPAFKWVKTEIMTLDQAEREAKTFGIESLDNNAKKGRIGALGAVLRGNRGIEATGLYGEHL